MVPSSWFLKYLFYNSVLNRFSFMSRTLGKSLCLRKAYELKTFLSLFFSLLADNAYRAIHHAAKGWSALVTASWGKFNWKRPVYRGCKDQSSSLPWGDNRWEKAMKWQTGKGTRGWLSRGITKAGQRGFRPRWAKAERLAGVICFPLDEWIQALFHDAFFTFLIVKSFRWSWLS